MTRLVRAALPAVLSLTVLACDADPLAPTTSGSAPLIGGTVDADDPAVVALSFGGNPSEPFCTGTLVSPSVVLTAAHCVDMFGADPNIIVFFGTDTHSDGTRIGVKDKQQNLGWTGSLANEHDVAMVLLNFPADPLLPLPLNHSPAADHVGEPYRQVGFGVFDNPNQSIDGRKRTGTTAITTMSGNDVMQSGDDQVVVCFGDSGGPGLLTIDDVEYVTGIHSYTTGASGQSCAAPNGDTRVDIYVDDFILPWIQEHDPTCGADGLCAPIGCIDDPDCQPCGRDGTCTDGCALPDPDCPTSEVGEICQADSQCTTGLCVFWRGDTDYKFCSEPCEVGSSTCPTGMSCQNVQPFGDVCYYDDDPPGVLGDACDVATDCGSYLCLEDTCVTRCDLSQGELCPDGFECKASGSDFVCLSVATESGGCGCRTSRGGGPTALLMAAALLLVVGRRRRR